MQKPLEKNKTKQPRERRPVATLLTTLGAQHHSRGASAKGVDGVGRG